MKGKRGAREREVIEAAEVERNLAAEALKAGDLEQGWAHFQQVLGRLSGHLSDGRGQSLFVHTSLEFSNLCARLGRGFDRLEAILNRARAVSQELGDRRSRALVGLHLGRLHYLGNRIPEAMAAFSEGKAEVEDLGDEDIRIEAAEFIGMHYFMQGRFSEALPQFEEAARGFEADEPKGLVSGSAPLWLSLCTYYLGHFQDAIGTADYYYRLALAKADRSQASMLQALLGIILLVMRREDEAVFHLSSALEKAVEVNNVMAGAFAKAGMGHLNYRHGRMVEARDWIVQALEEGHASGLMMECGSDVFIETLFSLSQEGGVFVAAFDLQGGLERIMRQPNIHLRGLALRLKAIAAAGRRESQEAVGSLLASSERFLIESGDPVQLAKTRLEMARLKMRQGDEDKARELARKAWLGFSGCGNVFFPDDLRGLLVGKDGLPPEKDARAGLLEMFVNVMHELKPTLDLDRLLARILAASNRFFRAERGGVFWFPRRGRTNSPVLRVGHNLCAEDVSGKGFRWSLSVIAKACREGRPLVVRNEGMSVLPTRVRAVVCIPFEVQGRVLGVLYHDSLHVEDGFDAFEVSDLARIGSSLAGYVEHLVGLSREMERRVPLTLGSYWQADSREIVARSRRMLEVLAEVDRVAESDSTVLIMGETGVGKELVAHRVHLRSGRREGPFVIVDPTTIPEGLVESELFGHEKGAFTGAERRKVGRLELAHGGTLFIDEVAEVPKSVQAKLLRALQDKTFVRVGSNGPRNLDRVISEIFAMETELIMQPRAA